MRNCSKKDRNDQWLEDGSKRPFRLFYPISIASFTLFASPEGLAYTSLSFVRQLWWMALFLNCAILLLVFCARSVQGKGKRIDSVIVLAFLTLLPMAVFTLSADGSLVLLLRKAVYIIGPWLYLAVFGEYGFKPLLKAMLIGSIIVVVANAISIIVMSPYGSFRPQYEDTWLFGQRTYMRNFIFPCLMFSVLMDRLRGVKISFLTLFVVVVSLFSIVRANAMTSLVVFLIMILTIVLSWRGIKKISVFRLYFIGAIVVDVLLVYVRRVDLFRVLIEEVLNRNLTLSFRTEAWDIVLDRINNDPFTGMGVTDLESSDLVVGYGRQLSNAHNQILDVWYKGGLLSLLFFVALVIRCVFPLLGKTRYWAAFVLGVFVGGFCIEAVVSDVWYPQFFFLLYLSAYVRRWAPLFEKNVK